ncbi:MAG: hypothetical protein M3347_00010 [Armatimonadota bacterium]|nr:hypothetical protein [Armatimonadota bacterium]
MSFSTPFSLSDIIFGLIIGLAIVQGVSLWARHAAEHRTIMIALLVKLLACVAYCVTLVFVYGTGDTMIYHTVGINYADMIRADWFNGTTDYLANRPFFWIDGYPTVRFFSLSGLVHFLLFDSFLASSLVFAWMSFMGQLLLYRTFVARYPDPRLRLWWQIGILFFPSLTFWSAGMLKESVGLWALGCAVWGAHSFLLKSSFRNLCLTVLGLYGLFLFRYQVLPALLVAFIPWLLEDTQSIQTARRTAAGMMVRGMICLGLVMAGLLGMRYMGAAMDKYSLEALPDNLAVQSKGYAIEPLVSHDSSWAGMLRAAPAATAATLYRPFVWEASSAVMQAAALESLALIILSLRALFQVFLYPSIVAKAVRTPTFLGCLLFVVVFGLLVGVSTPNLGSLSRYRIPLIPFFAGMLIIMEYYALEFRAAFSRNRDERVYARAVSA